MSPLQGMTNRGRQTHLHARGKKHRASTRHCTNLHQMQPHTSSLTFLRSTCYICGFKSFAFSAHLAVCMLRRAFQLFTNSSSCVFFARVVSESYRKSWMHVHVRANNVRGVWNVMKVIFPHRLWSIHWLNYETINNDGAFFLSDCFSVGFTVYLL